MNQAEYGQAYRNHRGQASRAQYLVLAGRRSTEETREEIAQIKAKFGAAGYTSSGYTRPAPKPEPTPYTGYQYLWEHGQWEPIGEHELLAVLRQLGANVESNTARMKAGQVMRTPDGALYRWVEGWLP